jgi:hypothetical protein
MACTRLRRTQLVHEDTRLTQFAYKLQNRITAAICANAGGGDVEWNNFLFVDQEDPSLTPERGSLTNKYGTIQAAVDAALEGDVILINPGDYVENVDLTDIVNGVTIQGAGPTETFITGVTIGMPAVRFTPTAENIPLITLTIKDLAIYGIPADEPNVATPIAVICDTLPSSFTLGGFILENVRLGSTDGQSGCSATFSCINNANIDKLYAEGSPDQTLSVVIRNCGSFKVTDSRFGAILAEYDYTGTMPSDGRQSYQFSQCTVGSAVTVNHQCIIEFDSECYADSIDGLIDTYLDEETEEIIAGRIKYEGTLSSGVWIFFDDLNESLENTILIGDFDHAKIDGPFKWSSWNTNTSVFDVVARNAVINSNGQLQITADGTILVQGGKQLCRMDLSNSTFPQNGVDPTSGLLANGTGIDRTIWFLDSREIDISPATTAVAIAPPYYTDLYNVHYDVSAGGLPITSAKTVDGFTSTAVGGATASITLIQQK